MIRLALINAAMHNCNASRDGKCLRYKRHWRLKEYDGESLKDSFADSAAAIRADLGAMRSFPGVGEIVEADSRHVLVDDLDADFKLCVTSPPYLNSFDYTDVYRPELFLGGFVESGEELRALRYATVRSHVQADWEKPIGQIISPILSECLQRIEDRRHLLWDRRIPDMIQAYFEDMLSVLTALRQRARRDASLWIVVSTSAYVGVEIPVDLIIGHVGTLAGWRLREVSVVRHLRTSGQRWQRYGGNKNEKPQLRESVVILDAMARRVSRRAPKVR
ncbi:MAG: hypothetical protein ABIP48_05160 [Planctomycetota bacterium]